MSHGNEDLRRPRIEYRSGNENSPEDPFGRAELVLEPDGRARLDHYARSGHRAWTGRVDPNILARLWSALECGGFPEAPRHPLPAGAATRSLFAEAGGARRGMVLAWHAARELPGYDEAFMILDSLVRQLSEDSIRAAPDALPPAVTDLRRE